MVKNLIKNNYIMISALVLIGTAIRIYYFYSDANYWGGGDWIGYNELALRLKDMAFGDYDFTRTPGFPLIMLLARPDMQTLNWNTSDFTNVVIIHMGMGILMPVILYFFLNWTTKKYIAVMFSLLYSIYLPPIYFEYAIVTETTALFFFTLMMFLFVLYEKQQKASYLLLLGLCTSLLVLTKPQSIYLPLVIGIYLIYKFLKVKKGIKHVVLYALPNFILIGGWIIFFSMHTGTINLSTLGGNASFSKADYCCFEKIPKNFENDEIKQVLIDIYLERRNEVAKNNGNTFWTIWNSEMQKEMGILTGLTYAQRSKIFGEIAKETFKRDRKNFTHNTISGIVNKYRIQGIPDVFLDNWPIRFFNNWVLRIIYYLCEVAFLVSIIYFIIHRKQISNFVHYPAVYVLFTLSLIITQFYTAKIGYGGEGARSFNYCRVFIFIYGLIFIDYIIQSYFFNEQVKPDSGRL